MRIGIIVRINISLVIVLPSVFVIAFVFVFVPNAIYDPPSSQSPPLGLAPSLHSHHLHRFDTDGCRKVLSLFPGSIFCTFHCSNDAAENHRRAGKSVGLKFFLSRWGAEVCEGVRVD